MAKTDDYILENNSENSIVNFSEVMSMIHHTHQEMFHVANKAMVDLYWRIGQYISLRVAESSWGKGIVEELTNYISINEPKEKGFRLRIFCA